MKKLPIIGLAALLIAGNCFFVLPAITHAEAASSYGDSSLGSAANAKATTAADTKGVVAAAVDSVVLGPLAQVAYTLVTILGNLLGMIGLIFNWAVVITVFQFGYYFANSQGMLTAWGILRDIGNVVILFGFIFIGIMMILDLHSFDARRTLPRLVIFAVLLNFSLFAGEGIVDVANVLASQLYNQAGTGSAALSTSNDSSLVSSSGGAATPASVNVGIAGVIMQDTGISTSFAGKPTGDNTKQLLTYVGISIFFIVLMMVLIAGAIMLFTRAVMLSVLLVISPLAFAGMAIPQLEGRAMEWWNKLLSNAFFAPIYLLLIFIGLKVMEGARAAISGTNVSLINALTQSSANSVVIVIIFAMIIAFMIAALLFAKNSGTAGAAFATGFAQKAVSRTLRSPFTNPVSRIAARQAVGGSAAVAGRGYDKMMGKMSNSKNIFARGAAAAVRGTGLDEGLVGTINKAKGVKFNTKRTYQEEKDYVAHRTEHLGHAVHLADQIKESTAGIKGGADDSAKEKAAQALAQMPESDRNDFAKRLKGEELKNFSQLLTTDAFTKMSNNKDLAGIKHDLDVGRFKKAKDLYKAYDDEKDVVKKKEALKKLKDESGFSAGELEILLQTDSDFGNQLLEVADDKENGILNGEAVDSVIKNEKVLKSVRKQVKETQKKGEKLKDLLGKYNDATGTDADKLEERIKRLMSENNLKKEAAEVSDDKIWNGTSLTKAGELFASKLDTNDLAAIITKNEMNADTRIAITKHLEKTLDPTNPENARREARIRTWLAGRNGDNWGQKTFK